MLLFPSKKRCANIVYKYKSRCRQKCRTLAGGGEFVVKDGATNPFPNRRFSRCKESWKYGLGNK